MLFNTKFECQLFQKTKIQRIEKIAILKIWFLCVRTQIFIAIDNHFFIFVYSKQKKLNSEHEC